MTTTTEVVMRRIGCKQVSSSPAIQSGYNKGRVPAMKGRRYPPEILTPEEVDLLLCGCSKTSAIGKRNRALLMAMWRTGMRVSEALSLWPKDLDWKVGSVRVRFAKGGKHRNIGIAWDALDAIEVWMKARAARGVTDAYPLFCSLHGTPLSGAYVRTFLPRLARDAGLNKRVHPHMFRHTFAYELAMEKVPIHVIKAQLGHAHLGVTDRYINHLSPIQVVDFIHAREGLKP